MSRSIPVSLPLVSPNVPGKREHLRIVHVVTYGRPMAGTQWDTLYAARMQRKHHDVEVVVGNDGPFPSACRAEGIVARVIPFRNTLLDPVGDVRALIALITYFRRTRPDVVHTHSSKAGILGRVAARLAGVPVVVHTLHGPSYHDRQRPVVRRTILEMERLWARFTDGFIAVADALAEEFVRDQVCPASRIVTIGSALDAGAFPADPSAARRALRAEFGAGDGTPIIVTVGYLTRGKGFDVLIDAAALVLAELPDTLFLIVGPVLEASDDQDSFRAQIARLGIGDRVILTGGRDDVPAILAAADIFVQVSWREGLSRALLEAMFSGLAVIATDVYATAEVVHDGETGILIPPGDASLLASRLMELLRHPERMRSLGEAARRLMGQTRSVEAMGAAHDALYRRLTVARRRNEHIS